jgi:hypothetical protein
VDNLRTLLSSSKYSCSCSGQKQQSHFSLSPDILHSQGPFISPESVQHRGNLLQGSSEIEKRSMGGGELDGTDMPSCKACGRWKRQGTKSRGEKRWGSGILNLFWGVLAVLFAISFWSWSMDEDQGFQLVPT